jgi:hypothetical protein
MEGSVQGGQAVLKTVPSACTRWGFDSSTLCMDKEWTQITIYAPPGSWITPFMEKWVRAHGFAFNTDTVTYEDEDGAVVDFSPCPPLAR